MKFKTPMICAVLLAATWVPAFAGHGALATQTRDASLNADVAEMVASGWAVLPGKASEDLTNLEVAEMTAGASRRLMAQDPSVTPENGQAAMPLRSLARLVQEFRRELAVLDVNVDKVEKRIRGLERRNLAVAELQEDALAKTGTEVSGFAKSYFNSYRGMGPDATRGPSTHNGLVFADFRFQCIPASSLLFDARVRLTRTIGLYYADPIESKASLRWLSFGAVRKNFRLTAGDFYKRYTPLTLWNYDIPVYTLVEPVLYQRARKSVEEWLYLDHGNDWRLKGLDGSLEAKVGRMGLDAVRFQALVGGLHDSTVYRFSDFYTGAQMGLEFLQGRLEVKGTGLVVQNDPKSANVPYLPNLISTYARSSQVGSVSSKVSFKPMFFEKIEASAEWAGSRYQDNDRDEGSILQDWAFLGDATLTKGAFRLSARYLSNGPYFYSSGAQTNRYTPSPGVGYLSTNLDRDDGLPGYLNQTVFRSAGRPSFAVYDRFAENALPYGDSTPNREGYILGLSADFGKEGWLKVRAKGSPHFHEIQPNYVFTAAGNAVLPVDYPVLGAPIRQFKMAEGALILDGTKLLTKAPPTLSLALDLKNQSTRWSDGARPFTVNTFIVAADAGPFSNLPGLRALVFSMAFEKAASRGSEFTLYEGLPPTLAQNTSLYDTAALGSYAYRDLNIDKTSWAFGFRYPISPSIRLTADLFLSRYRWRDVPDFDRRDQTGRVTYEVSF